MVIRKKSELEDKVAEALEYDGPVIIEVMVKWSRSLLSI